MNTSKEQPKQVYIYFNNKSSHQLVSQSNYCVHEMLAHLTQRARLHVTFYYIDDIIIKLYDDEKYFVVQFFLIRFSILNRAGQFIKSSVVLR